MSSLKTIRRGALAASCAVGALALLVTAGGTANAATVADSPGASIVSGTGTIYMSEAYIQNMAANNIVITPLNMTSVTDYPTFTVTKWNLDGGNPNLAACTGTVNFDGGSLVTNTVTGAKLLLSDIRLDTATDTVDYTLSTPAGDVTIVGLDLGGVQFGTVLGDHGTYNATALYMNRTAAADMDSVLGTNAFADTKVFGAFSASYTLSEPNSPSGIYTCG